MAITIQMREQVSQLYVALFGRAPDGEGLGFWVQQLGSGTSLADVANTMYAVPAARAYYPGFLTNQEIIASFYVNVLGRTADTEGLNFWTARLNAAGATPGSVINEMIAIVVTYSQNGGTDPAGLASQALFENKAEIAQWYGERNGNIDGATAILGVVTADPASVEIAKTLGKTFSLTSGLDNVEGTWGDDVIIGKLSTLSMLDMVNGGAGTDILKISFSLPTIALPDLFNVEIIEVTGTAGVIVNATATTGVTNLYIVEAGAAGAIDADAGATTDVSVAMKAAGAAVDVDGGKEVTVKLTDVAASTNAVSIGTDSDGLGADLSIAAAGNVVVETSAAAAANGADITMGAIAVTGGIIIGVTQKVGDAGALVAGDGATTHTQGNVTITGNARTTEVTVRQDADVAAQNGAQAVVAVAEVASVGFGALTVGQTLTTNGLTFTAAKNLTAVEVAQAFASLAAGIIPAGGTPFAPLTAGDTQASGVVANGVYSGALTGWSSAAASGDTVVFTSMAAAADVADLAFTGSGTATVTTTTQGVDSKNAQTACLGVTAGVVSVTDANATIKTITVDGYGNGSSTTGTTVLETLNLSNADDNSFTVAAAAATLALNLEKVGKASADAAITFTAAPATLNVKSTGNNHVNLTAAATTTLNVSGTGLLDADATDLAALRTVKVTETAGLSLNAGVADTVESVDTTGTTGTVTVSIDGTRATYAGGAGKDIVTLTTAAPTKVINTGAGDDRVVLANGTTAIGTGGSIEGGDGLDTLVFTTTADAVTASGSATFATRVTGFERLVLRDATGAQAVDVAALGNYNDVVVTAGNAGAATLTLNNLSSGATIRLNDAVDATNAADAIVANIKDANKSDADVLNVAITATAAVNGTADGHGTITAADVETINISVTDGLIQTPDVQNLTLVATEAIQIVITGDTALNLNTASNQKVTLIDASELAAGLTVTAAGGVATTIKGGTGNDVLIASMTDFATGAATADILIGGAGNDILVANAGLAKLTGSEGNDLFAIGIFSTDVDSYSTVEDFQAGDLLKIVGASAFKSAKVDLGDMAEFQALADAAIDSLAVNEVGWFQFGGNTYVVLDAVDETTAGFTNGQDFIVKLTGLIDLGNASFNSDHATIALV